MSRTTIALGSEFVRGLGTPAATNQRGLTSNRHAGRPDRQSIRAFAFDGLNSVDATDELRDSRRLTSVE